MKRNKPRTLELGTISEGTLRPEDLLPEYLYAAEHLRLSKSERETVRRIARTWSDGFERADEDFTINEDVTELEDILSNHVPPYCYFGALEGDGACFGVWVAEETLQDDIASGEVWRCEGSEDDEDSKLPGWRYRLVVNDHGNMTLYTRGGREVWGVV